MPQINANLTLNTAQAQATFNQFVRTINSSRIGQPLGRISGDAAEFNKSMQAATARVTAFGLSAGAIIQVKNAIIGAANATIEVDKQLIELNTFLGQSTSELGKFSKSLFQVAKNTAAPFSEAAGAAKEFARQGLSANEVLERTESALTLARISGLDFKDSVQGITTAINSFGKEALKATEITNKLIAVDTRFAVSSADLNEAIRRVGSSAEESGVGIDSLIAAVTAAQQTTGRGGAVIGNALKTIFTRLQRPEVLTQLEQLGVAVKDQNGFLLDGIGILKNFSDATKNLSQAERSRTAELIGGVYQINQLNALIKDLSSSNSVYANSLRISNSATDEAAKKNEELNKSMSSMLQSIKTTATEVASSFGSSFLRPIVEIGSMVSEGLLNKISPSEVGSKLGSELIKGLSGALGEGLSKTALPLLASIGGLLAVKLGSFGSSAFKELGKASTDIFTNKKDLELQKRINDVVARNPALITAIIAGKKTQAQAEAQILDFILKQNQQLRVQGSLSRSAFGNVMQAQKAAPRKKVFGIFADGYLPNFAMSAEQQEVATAKAYGAKNPVPRVIQATIRGKTGPVVVNNQEKVIPNFAGTRETAIIPNYRKLDEIPRMAKGYVPNFAREKITAAAYKTKKGNIFTGSYHAEAYEKIPQDENNDILDGFITNSGKFVDRKEAGLIAEAAMQMYDNANTKKYFRSNNYKLDTAFLPMPRDRSFSSGYIPNFAFSSVKSSASGDRKFVDPETYSYLRYKLSDDKKAIDLKYSKSEIKGQGWQMFERLGKTARRMGLPVRSSNLSSQTNDVLDITDASLARAGKYGIEGVLKVGYPQLIHRQKGSSKNTTLSLNIDDGLGHKNKELSGKDIFSVVSDFASIKYKGDAKLFRNSIIDGSFDISNVETNFAGGRIPNFAKRKDIIQRIGKKEIFARFQKHFEAGKDYQGFYNIHGEEFNNRKLTAQEAKIYANITSAISPSVPDYVAAQFAAPIFNRFMQTRSTNVEDYFDLAPSKIVSRHKNVASLGLFGLAGTLSKKGKIRARDDARRSGLSKALRGIDLGSDDTAKTRHYARAILQDKTAFPIDTNVIQAILGGKKPSKTEAAKLVSLANEFATLNKIETGAAGLQAAIFKSNSKHTEKYSPDTVRSALSGIQGRSSGYVPNFAKILIAAKYYDALKVGKAKGVSISKTGDVQNVGREVFGGIGFSTSRIGKGYASAVRSTSPTTSLKKASEQAGVTKSIIIPVVASSAVNDPVPENLKTNEALLQQFLANHPQPKEVVASLSQQGFNVKSILNSHSGSEIKSIIDILSSDLFNKKILTKSADELKDPRLVKFFAPGGVKARGPKGTYAFGSSIASMQQGEYASKTPGKHKSYPILVTGKSGPEISKPINAEEIFPGITNKKNRLFFSSVYQFGTRILDTDNPEHMELLGRLGYSQQRLQQENLMAGGYIPNFSGLSKAVSREKTMSGLPASQIMAHFDGGGNPIAVTNKRDEPNGLKDVPNFAIPKGLLRLLSSRGSGLTNPITGSAETFIGNVVVGILNQLAENEKVPTDVAAGAAAGFPAALGIKNILQAATSKKSSKVERLVAAGTGLGQIGFGALTGFSAKGELEKRINEKRYLEALDRSKTSFQNLTENTAELADTFAKLESAYADPQADPRTIAKLAKKQEELLNKITFKNPDLVAKLSSETNLGKRQTIIEESTKEAQRQESIREQSLKFLSQGKISGKDAPEKISDFFASIINSGNAELLNQNLSGAQPSDFGNILKKGGLDVEEFSKIFRTDDLKKSFIEGLIVTQKLTQLSNEQASVVRELSKPLTEKKQKIEDTRAVRLAVSTSLKEQLPELASFAGGFSRRAGISAASDAGLAITRSEASVAFNNSLMSELANSKFSDGLPADVRNRLLAIQSPSRQTGQELESLKTLPGLSKEQIAGIEKLIGFNSQQNRKLENANKIANETKNVQLKFLALQEKLAFGGDIRSSIDPEARAEAMSSAIRGPLTYQLGGLLGSRRTQIGGATDFLTDTIKKYPGLLQTKDGKEPADIQAVKRELTGLNAMDMQRDLLKRASMAEMMGLGQTGSMLRSKAFDRNYLLESAGLKTSALFGSPEVPEEIKRAMEGYEKFNVEGVRQFKGEEKDLKNLEDQIAPIKQAITDKLTKEGSELAKAFKASLTETFGKTGIVTDIVNISTRETVDKDAVNKNVENASKAYSGLGGLMPTGIQSNANGLTKYSSSIADAVKREKTALASRGIMGVPNFAMAGINLERSPDLITPSNPAGFAITNSIDEKNGLRSLGMRSSGFVPNYALPSWMNASNLEKADKARSVATNVDDAQSLLGNIKEGNIGGAAMDLAGPALDVAKFAAKNVAKKAGLGAAGIGLDVGEYIVKPLSEKLGVTDYLADRMYNALYAKPEKSNIARASDAYNSRLGNDLIDPSPEYMKKAKVPNFALFGDKVAAAGLAAAQSDKLYVYDKGTEGFHKVSSSGGIDYKTSLDYKSLPKGAKTISTELYASAKDPVQNTQKRGSNILGIKDPKVSKLNELQISTIPKSQLLDPVLEKLSGAGRLSQADNLTPENLRDEVDKLTGGKRSLIKTAFGPKNYGGYGVFGRNTDLGLSDYEEIIKRYKSGADSGFFAQTAVKGPYYGETRVHVAVDANGRVKLVKGATMNKIGTGVDSLSKEYINDLMAENPGTTRKQMEEVARANKKASEAIAVRSAREYVKKFGIKNTIFGVDTIATTLESAQEAGATAKAFNAHNGRKLGAIVIEMNPTDVAGSSGYMKGSAVQGLVNSVLGIENKPQGNAGNVLMGTQTPQASPRVTLPDEIPSGAGFNRERYLRWLRGQQRMAERRASQDRIPDESPAQSTPRANRGLPPAPRPTGPGSNLIGTPQQSMPAEFAPRALPPLPRPTGPGSNLIGTQQPSMPAGFAPRGGEAPPIPGGTGGGLPPRDARGRFTARGGGGAPTGGSGGPPPSNSYFGSMAFGSGGSGGGNPPAGSSTILNKLKGAGATGLKGLGLLFGAMQAKESYDEAKEGNYGKSTLAGLSSAASFAGLSKTAGKIAGPAGVALGALTDLRSDLTLAEDWSDIFGRRKRTYSVGPDGKTKEDIEPIGAGDIIGTAIGAITAAPVTAAILGYRTGNIIENKYRVGERLGDFASAVASGGRSLGLTSGPIRGMKSKEAYDSDQILTRKMELVKEINKYNRAAGNPEISFGENISKAKKAQERKDEADISALQEKLDKENEATRAGITARATAAGAAETGILNKKSTEEEEARRTKLRRSFIESFEKNGGADRFQTTKEKVEYFLSLERQLNQGTDPNGFGTFKPTDFKDPEFAKSFDIYKRSKEAEAAKEAKRVFPKTSEEFKNRPPQQSFPDDVLREAVRTGRSAERVIQDREDEKIKRGLIPPIPLPSQTEIRNRPDPFTRDVLLEAARRRVPAEKIIQEREAATKEQLPLLPPALMGEIAIAGKSGSLIPGPLPSKIQGSEDFDPNKPDSYPADVVAEAIRTGRKPEQVIKDRAEGIQATDVPGGYSKGIIEEAMNRRGLTPVPQAPLPPQPKARDDSSDPFPRDVLLEATRRGVSAERVMQDRAGLGGGFMTGDEANVRRGAMTQGMTLPEINQQEARETGLQNFPKDVLEEAMRRRVTAEQVMRERAGGAVPNFAAMSNSMMSSGDVYSRMRATSSRSSMSGYSGGHVPNFAAADFTNAISEAMKNGITSAFPNGGSSSNVSNSNVINIDGRMSMQNAPDEAMQGIIGILFDKFPELKKLGPSALNFKR